MALLMKKKKKNTKHNKKKLNKQVKLETKVQCRQCLIKVFSSSTNFVVQNKIESDFKFVLNSLVCNQDCKYYLHVS